VQNRVLGAGTAGTPGAVNTSLKGTDLGSANLKRVFAGNTGFGTSSGFGYVLQCQKGSTRHAVIATRGTRPELGAPDLLTDIRASMTRFGDYGLVHKGFKTTFDSVLGNLARDNATIMNSDVVHCVGHSLGGAVATLVAAHYARQGKKVKLYTFGSPRVGAMMTYFSMQRQIGKSNIFRAAHDLDPVSLVGPYPYIHVNPSPQDANNFTLPSPTGSLFSTANHDMTRYIDSVGSDSSLTWEDARGLAARVDHDNCVLAKWLLHEDNNPGWVQYASAKTLGLLFKLFANALRSMSTSLILGLSAVDLLAEMLMNGLAKAATLGAQVLQLLRYAAQWAGIQVVKGADFTAEIIGGILRKLLARLKALAQHAINTMGQGMVALPLVMAGGWGLATSIAI
jgi:pimeloyl-ACP methyl ester carboxylesterase